MTWEELEGIKGATGADWLVISMPKVLGSGTTSFDAECNSVSSVGGVCRCEGVGADGSGEIVDPPKGGTIRGWVSNTGSAAINNSLGTEVLSRGGEVGMLPCEGI